MTLDGRLIEAMNDPITPFWAQRLIRDTLNRDPVDVANVLEVISGLYSKRAEETLKREMMAAQGR